MKEYIPFPLYYNYVVTYPFLCFDFVIHYTELMQETHPVFPHRHNLYEIFYVVDGNLRFGCEGRTELIGPQEFVFIGKNRLHRIDYLPNQPVNYFAIIFDIVLKRTPLPPEAELECIEIMEALKKIDQGQYQRGYSSQPQTALLNAVLQESQDRSLGWLSQSSALYCQLFLNLLREVSKTKSRITRPLGYKNIALTAVKYIHANHMDDITIDMMAQALNVTPRHINRLFHDLFGSSFTHVVNAVRLEYAKEELLNSKYSIERIAAHVGLPSGKALTKLFYNMEGISPTQYRAQNQKKIQERNK